MKQTLPTAQAQVPPTVSVATSEHRVPSEAAEGLSAWLDGQTDAPLVWQADTTARWDAYRCIGEALRGQRVQAADLGRVAGVMEAIAALPATEAPHAGTTHLTSHADVRRVPWPHASSSPSAANDHTPFWRRMAVAASVSLAMVLGWQWQGPVATQGAPVLAERADTAPLVATGHAQGGVMLRDPALEALLNAHRQVSGSAFDAPAGFLKAATFEVNR